MKSSKIKLLSTSVVLLFSAGLLSGCGDEPDEAFTQSDEIIAEALVEEPVQSLETIIEPISDDLETYGLIDLDDLSFAPTETIDAAEEITTEASDTLADTKNEVITEDRDTFVNIDQILERLEFGNISFNVPSSININETRIIQLFLALGVETDKLSQLITAEGTKENARIKVTNRMEARLSGTNFSITSVTPETQVVSRTDVTEWKWEVKPLEEGRHHLHLTLSILITLDGETTHRTIRTFDKKIDINVTLNQRVESFIKNNWQWLWAVILTPIIGFFWRNKKKSKPGVNET